MAGHFHAFLRFTLLFALLLVAGDATGAFAQAAPRVERSGSVYHVRLCPPSRMPNVASCDAHVVTDQNGQPRWHRNAEFFLPHAMSPMALPFGLGPADLASAYKVTSGGSAAITIAIVDAYGYANAESDLSTYRNMYGLPACTTANGCFTKVDQNGGTSYPAYNAGWAGEQALDLDMVSALCPNCKILLVQANSAYNSDLAFAVSRAAQLGAHAISNSYGSSESGTQLNSYSSYYNIPGVAVTVSTGDSGYGVQMPAAYPGVIAVGGTSLSRDSSPRGWAESAWSGAGSGCSAYVSKPSWQTDTGCTNRTVADVSAVADPNTGVAVYGPVSGTTSGWGVYGGTSASAPIIAALYGVNGGNVNAGQNPYLHASSLFDVTAGSNGSCSPSYLCSGLAGYDGPTGLGTPNGVVAFGEPPSSTYSLNYTAAGAGSGTVGFSPSGTTASCTGSCTNSYNSGTVVTLTAGPATGSVFSGWSGNAACSGTGTCQLTMSAAQSVTATFDPSSAVATLSNGVAKTNLSAATGANTFYSIDVPAGATNLSVNTSGGSGDADLYVSFGTQPTSTSYACRPYVLGNNETCSFATPSPGTYYIMLNAYQAYSGVSLVASYSTTTASYPLNYTAAGAGTGTVGFSPSGTTASCTGSCTNSYNSGTVVTLTASPATGSDFSGWSGNAACSGIGTCQLTMSAAQSVTATFDPSSTVTTLSNGVAKTNLSAATGANTFYSIDVPAGATNLSVNTSGGSGDADLYMSFGTQPTTTSYDCGSYLTGNNETCSFPTPSPGTYYIMLNANQAYGGLSLVGQYTNAAPFVSLSPSSLAFADQAANTTSSPLVVTLTNTGNANLVVSGVTTTGTDAAAFTPTTTCASVTPAATCTISVTFKPTSAGAKAASLSIASNLAGPPTLISLSGTGIGTAISQFVGTIDGPGFVNGAGTAARFNSPTGIAIDSSGNLYVTDSKNNLIRKVTSAGAVTTLAGQTLVSGSTVGSGTAARFKGPTGIAINGTTLYVTDTENQVIRKVTTAGVSSAFVGTVGSPGSANGTGTAALFKRPQAAVVDGGGNVFIADTDNSTIRKATSAGVVTLFAGTPGSQGGTNGTGTVARFSKPTGIGRDASNNLYVTDVAGQTVRRITSAAVVTTFAGSNGVSGSTNGSTGTSARFSSPSGVVVDSSGNIFIGDGANGTVRRITSAGAVTTFVGTAGSQGSTDGTGAGAMFYRPAGIARDANNNLYVADPVANTIRKITTGGVVTTLAGYSAVVGANDNTGSLAGFRGPSGVVADSSGNLFIADTGNHTIRKVTPAGVVTTFAGLAGTAGSTNATGTSARFNSPNGLAIDSSNNIYVADTGNHTIRKVTSGGVVTTVAGLAGISGSTNATGTSARFNSPAALAVTSAGILYVADTGNYTIRKIVLSTGAVTTLAGAAGTSGTTDSATGTSARFGLIYGLGVASNGNIFVSDFSGSTIRKIVPTGTVAVSTFAGAANTRGTTNATGTSARFSSPYGLTVDASNNIYVSDYANCLLRKITSIAVVTTPVGTPGTCKFVAAGLPSTINAPLGLTKSGTSLFFTAGNGVGQVTNVP